MAGRSRSTGSNASAASSRPGKLTAATPPPPADPPPVEPPPAAPSAGGATLKTPRRIALDAAFKERDDLRQGLAEHLGQRRGQRDQVDERVERAFAEFTPTLRTPGAPAPRRQVPPGAAPAEAVREVMRERLGTLTTALPAPRIAIRPDNPLIAWTGDDGDPDTSRSGLIPLDTLITLMDVRGLSARTHGLTPALAVCQAERAAQSIVEEIERIAGGMATPDMPDTPETPENPEAGGMTGNAAGNAPSNGAVSGFVARAVDVQMATASAPEAQLSYGLIPNGADKDAAQARLLETFQLRPGPTDVTAYHDFSTLQIAFEHVWTRIFDGELEDLGRQLYREYVGLKDFLGYDPATADRPISSLDDLTWLIGEIRALSQIAQDALPPGKDRAPLGTANIPKGSNDLAKDATEFVESLPGGRVGTALGTLGISELVIWFLNEAANFGKKTALLWDDLVNGRELQRGDRIIGRVDQLAAAPGTFELVLKTDISKKKEVAFEIFDEASQKFGNLEKVANASGRILVDGNGQPEFYEDRNRIPLPSPLLPIGLLEFSSQDNGHLVGRYVLGDLDKIVPDGGRLTLYWKDA